MRQPTVGAIVHYQSYGTPGGEYLPEPRAAIVTAVKNYNFFHTVEDDDGREIGYQVGEGDHRDLVSVCVLNPTGMYFNEVIPYAEEPTPGHWNWAPEVEGFAEVTTAYEAFRDEALQRDAPHLSDCALHNEPAARSMPCDCAGRQAR